MRILILFCLVLACTLVLDASAQNKEEMIAIWQAQNNADQEGDVRAAACAPATALRDLEWNNVSALITTNGALWHDRSLSRGSYEVPKGGGVSVMYGGAIWMGGLSPDLQLKIAAMRYGSSGSDFWTGPLTTDGSAEIDEAVCDEYDQFYMSLRSDAVRHRQYFDCLADPTCDLADQGLDTYSIPSYFQNYPAHGNVGLGQDFYLAPFKDYDENGVYEPDQGDYPWYDFIQEINCVERRREDIVPLFGDQTLFWIGNDKGNIHSESQGEPIGMEIRAQAFAFSTNDEINNMTFYNFVLINQGTQTLTETYFGTWIDCDLGGFPDDYVGCDVQRGLGYAYNGDAFDDPTGISPGYGANPPAMGVDFFEGPYQDSDGIDNPLGEDFQQSQADLGIPYEGIGIGYGDDIIDNERFGMRKFLYHNFGGGINGLPELPLEHYNYLKGFWKNGQRMVYGGDALNGNTGADLNRPADYMFPGDTDPLNWGTEGVGTEPWTEQSAENPAGDRLFMQSAGPFTLLPGDYNNITVGVLYARASGGNPFASVELLRIADDKAQALFDNCFEIVSGPDAPDVTVQETENELILYLSNENGLSNNFNEEYIKVDPAIPTLSTSGEDLTEEDRSYKFQGYLVYQVANATISPTELNDPDKARLIHTVDKEDEIDLVINYEFNAEMALSVPLLMAEGPNEGIQHSFRVTDDEFATGDSKLINHRTYYFMILAYGYNDYEPFDPNSGIGQDEQFKASRSGAGGTSIRVYSGIPHDPSPEQGGTIMQAAYGDGIELTRIEGRGNGRNDLDLTAVSELEVLNNTFAQTLTYKAGKGPVDIKVVDPLNVPSAEFDLRLGIQDEKLDTADWVLRNLTMLDDSDPNNDLQAVYNSNKSIDVLNEDLVLQWGISITWNQYLYSKNDSYTEPVSATIEFDDPSKPWFSGIPDAEGFTPLNWIRSGTQDSDDDIEEEVIFDDLEPGDPFDEDELYESLLGGTWAPYQLVSYTGTYVNSVTLEEEIGPNVAPTIEGLEGELGFNAKIKHINNVDVVLTSDRSKWTRCGVLEMQSLEVLVQDNLNTDFSDFDDTPKMILRRHASVDKLGRTVAEGADPAEATLNGLQPTGMSWFPGYAIDIGTGERLNLAFGEDSWLSADNGNDMIFNPSDRVFSNIGGTVYAGGQHWIYVFRNSRSLSSNNGRMPAYDMGQHMYNFLEADFSVSNQQNGVFRSCTWVGSSLVNQGYEMSSVEEGLIPNDVRIRLRVSKEYEKYSPVSADLEDYTLAENAWNPYYTFSTKNVATLTSNASALDDGLKEINVVPNPYYAFSQYESGRLDNRVKITNLPDVCTIRVYNLQGLLVRTFEKADPITSLDWDLKNERNVPIAGGVYIIHIEVPDVGERILKWFGVMRPIDLENF